MLKGTPLRSGRVTHFFRKPVLFVLSTFVGHISLSCSTLICLLSFGNSLKTYIYILISDLPCSLDAFKF